MAEDSLKESAQKVFTEPRTRKAMPLLEIAATTGILGDDLDYTVRGLEQQNLVVVEGTDYLHTIVGLSGKYY